MIMMPFLDNLTAFSDNGVDNAHEYDDDWDQDGLSNLLISLNLISKWMKL